MSYKIVRTTRNVALGLAAAWLVAPVAHADIIGTPTTAQTLAAVSSLNSNPIQPVTDSALAAAQAVSLQASVKPLTSAPSTPISSITNVRTGTNANPGMLTAVRLWDEVIPPAPAPKPTQTSQTTVTPTSSGVITMQSNTLKIDSSVAAMRR